MTYLNPFRNFFFLISVIVLSFTTSSCEEDIVEECGVIAISASLQTNGTYLIEVESADLFSDFQWALDTLDLEDITTGAFEYQFGPGTYELCLSATSESCGDLVDGCITFTVEDTDEGDGECPQLSFETEISDDGLYIIDVIDENPISIHWTVNGDTVGTGPSIEKDFTAGTYEVCVVGTFEGCDDVLSHCETFEIEENCQEEVSFEYHVSDNGIYVFELINENPESVLWTINGDTISNELAIEKQLTAGSYEVCVYATFENCDAGATYCEVIEVAENCPEEIAFEYDMTATGVYVFELVNENATVVEWILNGQVVGEGERLEKELSAGEYSLCVIASFENCDITLEYCKDIIIEEDCPDVRFGTNYNEADGTYEFVLGSTDGLTSVFWKVNGEIVGQEAVLVKEFDAGTYEVCVVTMYEDCSSEITYCETIVVEDEGESGCPDMFFAYQKGEGNTYFFFADFEGIENLEWYGWFIDGSSVEDEGTIVEGSDHMLEFTFNEPGTHTVCIMTETPDCPAGTSYCKEIVIE